MSSVPGDGSTGGSRPSKNNRQGCAQGGERPELLEPSDLPGDVGLRPVSVEPGRKLRDEAVMEQSDGPQSRPVYAVVNEWREWMHDYQSMHIEYECDGETARTRLENSYMPEYGKRYYAKLKDLERGIEREYENLTTAMLTFSASALNAEGLLRCTADHMRDVAGGFDTARKQLYQVLDGYEWEYAKVWEPHPGGDRSPGGYGHLHVAVFVEADDLDAEVFKPVLESHVRACDSAGSDAHRNTPCEEHRCEGVHPWNAAESGCDDCDNAVSVNDDVENLGSYISEYIGIFGDRALDREMHEQVFYATTWATGTRRVEFSNGAQEIINDQQFRRETGLRPEDRGETGTTTTTSDENGAESGESVAGVRLDPEGETVERTDESDGWDVESICTVRGGEPDYADPTTGGVEMTAIAGRPGMDPPAEVE